MKRILITGGSGFIGTNLIDELLAQNFSILNIDINPPKKDTHFSFWKQCDILDLQSLMGAFEQFQPAYVIHLAARTDTLSEILDDYRVNFEGTDNLLHCIKSTPSVERFINTSSQFAFAPPGFPAHDEDFNPIGAYGKSKVMAEKAVREAGLQCVWTTTRPTNIWGPWHPRYPKEFWLVLKKGWYIHPGRKPVMRSYGYVKNIVEQMIKILQAPSEDVNKKVYYLGDAPINLYEWANGFSLAITGKPVKIMPRFLLWMLAAFGSLLSQARIRFPITLSRYHSMTEDYFSPMDATFRKFGSPSFSLQNGIEETVEWLNKHWLELLKEIQ